MAEENKIPMKINESVPAKYDHQTGLMLAGSYTAVSGFNYAVGVREFGNLSIVEEVAQGTAVSYLNGVRVYDENKKLIIDKKATKGTHYSRETVRKIVLEALADMLEEAAKNQGKDYNRNDALNKIDEKLKGAYYSQSYQSVLQWAESIGIQLT
jgi:hypothetical protein